MKTVIVTIKITMATKTIIIIILIIMKMKINGHKFVDNNYYLLLFLLFCIVFITINYNYS